jgi:hypothetical protein
VLCRSSPATVFVSVARSKFFASLSVAPIWQLETKAVWVFIDHLEFFCDGFSENRYAQVLQNQR